MTRPLFRLPAVFIFFGGLLAGAFGGSLQHRIVRHAGAAAAAQYQEATEQCTDHENDDDYRLEHYAPPDNLRPVGPMEDNSRQCDAAPSAPARASSRTRIKPSCAALATSRPSRENTLPRVKPRAPQALGLSIEYSSQSSTRTLR